MEDVRPDLRGHPMPATGTYGPGRDDAGKRHPCLVPYEDLPESEKAYDRNAAEQVLKATLAMGYEIRKV